MATTSSDYQGPAGWDAYLPAVEQDEDDEASRHPGKCTPFCGDCAICGTHQNILHNCGGRYVCTACWLSGAYVG